MLGEADLRHVYVATVTVTSMAWRFEGALRRYVPARRAMAASMVANDDSKYIGLLTRAGISTRAIICRRAPRKKRTNEGKVNSKVTVGEKCLWRVVKVDADNLGRKYKLSVDEMLAR